MLIGVVANASAESLRTQTASSERAAAIC